MPRTQRKRPAPAAKHPNVLVVVDDPGIADGIRRALGSLPVPVGILGAASGEQALLTIQEQLPDLVILDVVLGGMDGYQLCQHLREDIRTAFVPILMLAASGEDQAPA